MVMPRARSSGALSIWSNGTNVAPPDSANTLVIAAVSVVLPWSICPIVPMLQCGFVRANLALPIAAASYQKEEHNLAQAAGAGDGNRTHVASLEGWSSTIELRPPDIRRPASAASRPADRPSLRRPTATRLRAALVEGVGFEPT